MASKRSRLEHKGGDNDVMLDMSPYCWSLELLDERGGI